MNCSLKGVFITTAASSLSHMQIIPPYNGFGFLEDSLQNCFSLLPRPPKKNIIKMLENDHKVLRYQVTLVSAFLHLLVPRGMGRLLLAFPALSHPVLI